MDSLPQELVDAIIDNLPRSSLLSSSLVAKRWRTRSHRRAFGLIRFRSEYEVDRWHSDIQGGQNRILSYVRSVQFRRITSWNEPTLPGRVLKGFPLLTALVVYGSMIPDELLGQISRGEFGRGITALYALFPLCTLSVIMHLILSFPDLKELMVSLNELEPGQPSLTSSTTPKTRLLDWLELWRYTSGVSEALIQSQFTSKHLCLGCNDSNVHQLLALSSGTLVGPQLEGVRFSQVPNCRSNNNDLVDSRTRTPIDATINLPSFPTLTSLYIRICEGEPTRWLMSVLSFITSAPVLRTTQIQHGNYTEYNFHPYTWDGMDRWLAQVAEHTTVEGGPMVKLRHWSFDVSLGEALLPKFRKAGGTVKTDPSKWVSRNLEL